MERLTKLWFYNQDSRNKQRELALMKEHRSQYGLAGNCFDLAIWLLDELQKEGITAYPIGHNLKSKEAHVAVMAVDELGNRYLCDLGDQWIQPILVDARNENYTDEKLNGFFPGAEVQAIPRAQGVEIFYYRPNGKVSKQVYNMKPIEINYFLQAAEYSQNLIHLNLLLECRVPYKDEIAHWEFSQWKSFLSTSEGLFIEPEQETIEKWALKINEVTGYDKEFLISVLEQYKRLSMK